MGDASPMDAQASEFRFPPPHALDSRWLRTFLAVVVEGRVSAAARRLHLSQPAVTAQIQKLEDAVGQALLVRLPRGVEPTDAGRTLADYAQRVEALLQEAETMVRPQERAQGTLEIAASTTVAETVLPPLLESFAAAHPGVSLVVSVDNTQEATERVRNGSAPLALVEGLRRAPGVRLRPFVDDALIPCVGRVAPSQWRAIAHVQDLEHAPLALRERGSGTRAVVVRAINAALGRSRKAHTGDLVLGSNGLLLKTLARGMAVGFLSQRLLASHRALGARIQPLDALGLVIERAYSFALPAGELAPTAQAFFDHALRQQEVLADVQAA